MADPKRRASSDEAVTTPARIAGSKRSAITTAARFHEPVTSAINVMRYNGGARRVSTDPCYFSMHQQADNCSLHYLHLRHIPGGRRTASDARHDVRAYRGLQTKLKIQRITRQTFAPLRDCHPERHRICCFPGWNNRRRLGAWWMFLSPPP
jgi:hypothetical protein